MTFNWRDDPFVCFDLETSGVDPETGRIVSSCVALIPKDMGDGLGRRPKIFSHVVNPGVEISQDSIDVHGLTNEYLREHGKDPVEVIREASGLLRLSIERGIPIVGMNLRFDLTFIDRECQRHGLPPVADSPQALRPVVDVMVIDKAADPYRKKRVLPDGTTASTRNLTGLCEHWGVKLEGAHDASVDALASGRVAFNMARGPIPRAATGRPYDTPQVDVGAMKLGDLHDAQIKWAAQQAKNMAKWFRTLAGQATDPAEREILLAKADSCRPEWPFIPRAVVPGFTQDTLC